MPSGAVRITRVTRYKKTKDIDKVAKQLKWK